MEISKALSMYEVEDISKETKETLNKKYKKLSKIYHPDAYRDDGTAFKEVKEALDTLLDLLKQVLFLQAINKATPEEKLIYITLKELMSIYKNGSTEIKGLGSSAEPKVVTKSDIHKNRVYVIFSVDTLYKNEIKTFSTVNTWNVEDRYSIDITLLDDNIFEKSSVDVKLYNRDTHIDLNCTSTKYVITLDNDIKVSLNITKKLKI